MKRLVYASSVAAYGFHNDNPQPLTEDVAARGTSAITTPLRRPRSRKCSRTPCTEPAPRPTCSVPASWPAREAPLLIDSLPYTQISERLPGPVLSLLDGVPILRPVLPDPGIAFQLVHHDDVATAMRAGVLGRGRARRLQPRGARRDDGQTARRGARLVLDPGARAGRRRGRGDDRRGSASCRPRRSGSRPSASR